MQDAVLDFLCTALIPELGADISTGSTGNMHLALVAVAAIGAFPNEFAGFVFYDFDFAGITAILAKVALGVELRVDDRVVDMLHDRKNRRDVILHVRDLNITHGSTWRKLLELSFLGQFIEGVDLFPDVDVIGIGNVIMVGNSGDDAKALLKALGEFVGRGLKRSAIDGVVDVFFSLPFRAGIVEKLHDANAKFFPYSGSVGCAFHVIDTFGESGIAQRNRGIAIEEKLINGFSWLQTGQSPILPKNRSHVAWSAEQAFVAKLQGAVAEFQTIAEDFPEAFFVFTARASNIDKVNGDDALIEAAVVTVLTGNIIQSVGNVADARIGEAIWS